MNFAIPFFRNFKYPDQDNIQWNINYKPKIKQLDTFIEKYGTHRINLIVTDFNIERDCKIISVLKEKHPDTQIIICLPNYNKELEQELNDRNFSHYYNELVTTWDKFYGFLSLNVTDIFVAENLLFSVKNLSLNAKKNNKSLRCFCNVCQSSWDEMPSLKTFFMRPEDIDLYSQYIDTCQFYIRNNSVNNLNVLYQVYSKDKKWFGKLNEIIIGYDGQEDSRFIIPQFGVRRLDCEKRCIYEIRYPCKICDRVAELSETLKKNEIYVVINKERSQNEQ